MTPPTGSNVHRQFRWGGEERQTAPRTLGGRASRPHLVERRTLPASIISPRAPSCACAGPDTAELSLGWRHACLKVVHRQGLAIAGGGSLAAGAVLPHERAYKHPRSVNSIDKILERLQKGARHGTSGLGLSPARLKDLRTNAGVSCEQCCRGHGTGQRPQGGRPRTRSPGSGETGRQDLCQRRKEGRLFRPEERKARERRTLQGRLP